MKNRNLEAARKAKKDEFYTQLTDIEKELKHYKKHFRGKTVYCNCDNPFKSNFFKYFVLNFNSFGLKKLIATCYAGSEKNKDKPYKAVVIKVYDATGGGILDIAELFKSGENILTELEDDGDFRSDECLKLLEESDIVVTNPPFSLFREYFTLLIAHKKDFLIIGTINALTYKVMFPLLMQNKVWLGYKFGDMAFTVPEYFEPRETRYWVDEDGQKWRSLGNICWYTNLDIRKRHEELILVRKYTPENYPKYDNYDAINVGRVADIPYDYTGIMGVPITFMDKYNPDQFEILGSQRWSKSQELLDVYCGNVVPPINDKKTTINGRETYERIFIRNKHPEVTKAEN